MIIHNEILVKVVEQLNSIEGLPCEISIKELELDSPALFLHQTGGKQSRPTIAGSFDMEIQYELVYRAPTNSEKEILTAQAILDTLIGGQFGDWTRLRQLPDLGENREAMGYEIGNLSSVINVEEHGEIIYAMTFHFFYHQKATW